MSERRARCEEWLVQEGFYESPSSNFNPTVQVADSLQGLADALEAFAKAEQIRGMEAARRFVAEHGHHAPGTILARLDAEITKLMEGG